MISDLSSIAIASDSTIRRAMACIDRNSAKIALVVDDGFGLTDAITDGDIRRAILAGVDIDAPVSSLRDRRAASKYPDPVTARVGTESSLLLRMMRECGVRQIPILDEMDRVAGVVTIRDILGGDASPLEAVVMAGGYGTRLMPLTESTPKPMLPVGDKPLLERIIGQLRDAGVLLVNVTTHYESDVIAKHFGDGEDFGIQIRYIKEDEPLGTAGALGLLDETESPLLVINGDILTNVDFRAMLDFHQEQGADMTVAVRQHEYHIPYGVVELDDVAVTTISEKPVVRHFINAGIYLLSPEVPQSVPRDQPYDMPELIDRLLDEKRSVVAFPIRESWMDIGQIEDYEKAVSEMEPSRDATGG